MSFITIEHKDGAITLGADRINHRANYIKVNSLLELEGVNMPLPLDGEKL